jgi:hypothetical protein
VVAVAEVALLELLVKVIERVLAHAGRQRARPQRVPLFGRGRSRCRFRNRRIDVSTILVTLGVKWMSGGVTRQSNRVRIASNQPTSSSASSVRSAASAGSHAGISARGRGAVNVDMLTIMLTS